MIGNNHVIVHGELAVGIQSKSLGDVVHVINLGLGSVNNFGNVNLGNTLIGGSETNEAIGLAGFESDAAKLVAQNHAICIVVFVIT